MIRSLLAFSLAGLALSGCASGPKPLPGPSQPVRSGVVRVPLVMAPQGLEGVIGMDAAGLTQRFGNPRIDLAEGDTRKLQFAGATCVLDIYLYPPRIGVDPTAAHVAARLRQGGAAVDHGACIREVEGRSPLR